jgi:hypothetical protein
MVSVSLHHDLLDIKQQYIVTSYFCHVADEDQLPQMKRSDFDTRSQTTSHRESIEPHICSN